MRWNDSHDDYGARDQNTGSQSPPPSPTNELSATQATGWNNLRAWVYRSSRSFKNIHSYSGKLEFGMRKKRRPGYSWVPLDWNSNNLHHYSSSSFPNIGQPKMDACRVSESLFISCGGVKKYILFPANKLGSLPRLGFPKGCMPSWGFSDHETRLLHIRIHFETGVTCCLCSRPRKQACCFHQYLELRTSVELVLVEHYSTRQSFSPTRLTHSARLIDLEYRYRYSWRHHEW